MMVYTAGPFIGPEIGPLVGGFIVQNTTWRSVQPRLYTPWRSCMLWARQIGTHQYRAISILDDLAKRSDTHVLRSINLAQAPKERCADLWLGGVSMF